MTCLFCGYDRHDTKNDYVCHICVPKIMNTPIETRIELMEATMCPRQKRALEIFTREEKDVKRPERIAHGAGVTRPVRHEKELLRPSKAR